MAVIAVGSLFGDCAAQARGPVPVPDRGARVQLVFDAQGVSGCPAEPAARSAWFVARLENTLARLRTLLDLGEAPPAQPLAQPLQLFVLDDAVAAGPVARARCRREFQGLGVIHTELAAAVLVPLRKPRTAAAVSRLLAHVAVQLAVARELSADAADRLGYGWLAGGLAHHLAAEAGDGLATTFVVGDVVLDAFAWGGTFAPAAQSLLQRGQLPSLAALCATEGRDFDLAQHVAATALVAWLVDAAKAPVTGGGAMPARPLVELLAAARRGTPAHVALAAVLGQDLVTVEARWRAAIGAPVPVGAAPTARVTTPPHPPHPHAALYVYTDEPVRERHRAIVAAALQKRHAAHTSGWQDTGGKPKVALGPVNQRAAHWHGDEFIKPIGRVWPFVAVLEYAPEGAPEAFLDCMRRVRGRETDDGWMLDPTVGFVAHHNAQLVTGSDDRFMYLAVPDTPTGGHVSGSEFVHRGRIRWANGATAQVGVHTVFEAPQAGTTASWRSVQLPLVDWFVTEQTPRLGAVAVGGCELATGELAVWGTARVFRFPAVPAGLLAGRGRP